MGQLKQLLQFLFSHKLKYLTLLFSILVFALLLFPYRDVGDVLTTVIAKQSGNQVYLSFDRFKAFFFPDAAVGAEGLVFETTTLPAITAKEVEVRPSLGALLFQKPEGTLVARGLFQGDVSLDLKPGKKTEAGNSTHLISLKAEKLSLAEIHKVAALPMLLKGRVNLTTRGSADPTFQEQPDFDVDLVVDQFELPSGMVETQMGPLNLPELKLSQVEIKGRLSSGRFTIEKALVGKEGDELSGTIKGGFNLQIQNQSGSPFPLLGAYQFEVDLNVKKSLQDKAALFLSFLDAYKSPTLDGARFQFKLNANGPQMPPSLSTLR